jgi:hypothetical protein
MEANGLTDERRVFLSTLPAERGERRLALAVVLASAAVFLAAAPFAKLPLAQIGAFIPIYESALVINDLITAILHSASSASCGRGRCSSWRAATCSPPSWPLRTR